MHISMKRIQKNLLYKKDGGVSAVYETILSNDTGLYGRCRRDVSFLSSYRTEYLLSFVEINKKQSIIHRVEKIVF